MVCCFVDMLGTKAKWETDGVDGVQEVFERFKGKIIRALKAVDISKVIDGIIESDSCIICFEDAINAVEFAKNLYIYSFADANNQTDDRMWLRGVILPWQKDDWYKKEHSFSGEFQKIKGVNYHPKLLEVLSVEKSGFKGMRILLHVDLKDKDLQTNLKIPIGKMNLIPLRDLKYSQYPKRVKGQFVDYLWMLGNGLDEFDRLKITLTKRMRWAGQNPEEFFHAANTNLVFQECSAIVAGLRKGVRRRK